VPRLASPTTEVHASFLEAMTEYVTAGEVPGYADARNAFTDLQNLRRAWQTEPGFAAFVAWVRARALPESPRPPGLVPSLDLWWVDGSAYLGRVSIRTPLTDDLREEGGNIGYDIRPGARGRGHATAMLADAVPHAFGLGIDPALLTIQADNAASLAVARRNGARLFERSGTTLKLWLPTSRGLSS
jgi:predicted acetyltransferase